MQPGTNNQARSAKSLASAISSSSCFDDAESGRCAG
jgi:hypothetical protein